MIFPLGPLLHNTAALAGSVGGGGAFTPASITGLDFWVEAGDPTTLFTDLGSTAVTADGQFVEQWNDKSSAARNITQTVSAARPAYKTDLAKPSILIDGTHPDSLNSASSLTWDDGSGQQWLAVSAQANTTGTKEVVTISQGGVYLCDIYVSTTAHMEMENSIGGFQEDTQGTISAGTPFVIIGTLTTAQVEAFLDNVSGGATTLTNSPRTNTSTLIVGGSTAFSGRIFGVCHGKGVLSSTDRGNLQTYLAALHP